MVLHSRVARRREQAARRSARRRVDDGVTYQTRKGSLIGKDSGIETVEQAQRAMAILLGQPSDDAPSTNAASTA